MLNCSKLFRNVTFVVQIAYFCIRQNKKRNKQKSFCLFSASLEQFRYKMQLFWSNVFGATLEQLFKKFWATFCEISSNLWLALTQGIGFFTTEKKFFFAI